ncbi:MAG: glycosyltransferase [Blastocatellia bacterium]|nr:glycosyltransferase [Blastocatellia bacterium]
MPRRVGVRDRVVLAPATDVVEQLRGSGRVSVSSENDAFGMVVTEAMASGLPVIVSAAAGASEIVEHNSSGFVLASAEAAVEAGACLSAWSDDRGALARIGAAAREAVMPYTWDAIARQTMEVYLRAVRESHG